MNEIRTFFTARTSCGRYNYKSDPSDSLATPFHHTWISIKSSCKQTADCRQAMWKTRFLHTTKLACCSKTLPASLRAVGGYKFIKFLRNFRQKPSRTHLGNDRWCDTNRWGEGGGKGVWGGGGSRVGLVSLKLRESDWLVNIQSALPTEVQAPRSFPPPILSSSAPMRRSISLKAPALQKDSKRHDCT